MAQKASRSDFEAFYPTLIKDITQHVQQYNLPADALKWFQDSLHYNTANGKLNRGLAVLDTASILLDRPLNETEYTHLATLGWLTELLQAFFLVSDDIMDASHTRRGSPCWYRKPEVGMVAINDAFMLECTMYVLLKKYFRQHESYVDLLELFHEVTMKTEAGQLCDLLIAPEDSVDLSRFSYEKSKFIMTYKTAYYSFDLPVALALHYLRLATPNNLKQSHDILIPTGVYFQVQDDYLDVYGSAEEIGKIGTDIQENKCGWAVNEALSHCDDVQKRILEENYGRKDGEKEAKVKQVFLELDLPKRYREFEEKEVTRIKELIASIDESEGLRKGVFESFLNKIYKRSK